MSLHRDVGRGWRARYSITKKLASYMNGLIGLSYMVIKYVCTLQMMFSETRTFLAAKSLWTNCLPLRYVIPTAISLQNFSKISGNFA